MTIMQLLATSAGQIIGASVSGFAIGFIMGAIYAAMSVSSYARRRR